MDILIVNLKSNYKTMTDCITIIHFFASNNGKQHKIAKNWPPLWPKNVRTCLNSLFCADTP